MTDEDGRNQRAAMKREENAQGDELEERRKRQLKDAERVLKTLQNELRSVNKLVARSDALASHSGGFYDEVEKLTKGRGLIEATDLITKKANEVIREAKDIIKGDLYLDQVEQFVPAGNNPLYPDVLVSIRAVRDSLVRGGKKFEGDRNQLNERSRRARTLIGALTYFLEDEEDDAETKNTPSDEVVQAYTVGVVSDSCFSEYEDSSERYFDFEKLDCQAVEQYVTQTEETDESGSNEFEGDETEDGSVNSDEDE